MATLFTNKEFKVDEDGFCKVYVAHIHKGDNYSVEEFADRDRLEIFVRHLKKHNFWHNLSVNASRYTSVDGGKNFNEMKISSLSF